MAHHRSLELEAQHSRPPMRLHEIAIDCHFNSPVIRLVEKIFHGSMYQQKMPACLVTQHSPRKGAMVPLLNQTSTRNNLVSMQQCVCHVVLDSFGVRLRHQLRARLVALWNDLQQMLGFIRNYYCLF